LTKYKRLELFSKSVLDYSNTISLDATSDFKDLLKYILDSIKAHFDDISVYSFDQVRDLLEHRQSKFNIRYMYAYVDLGEIVYSIYNCANRKNKLDLFSESMSFEMKSGSADTVVKNETLEDMGGSSVEHIDNLISPSYSVGGKEIAEIQDFFSRPVIIGSTDWKVGDHLDLVIDPWDKLLNQSVSIRSKLRNYAYFRGDLHLRISIAGSPFHYAKLLVSYQPFARYNEPLANLEAHITSVNYRNLLINYLSQAESSAIMCVRENKPLEISIPYANFKPLLKLFNYGTIAPVSSFSDTAALGQIMLRSINLLSSAVTGSPSAYVQVYGWFTNVQLGTSTGTRLVAAESEIQKGPVENIASRIQSIASTMEPALGPIATAAKVAAGAIRDVASIMGWSKPVMDQRVDIFRNMPIQNTSLAIGNSVARRIVLDPLQELDLGEDMLGNSEDQLTIHYLASRPSFYRTFSWLDSDVPMSTIVYKQRINPALYSRAVKDYTVYQPTSLAFAAQPFTYWRGSITFRFEFVPSQYHRGKVLIVYEPNTALWNQTTVDDSTAINKRFSIMVDLQETQMVEVTVNWARDFEWLPTVTPTSYHYLDETGFNMDAYCNGFIYVTPFTSLTSLSSTFIPVNVYVYSKDLQVAVPENQNLPLAREVVSESACLTSTPYLTEDLNPSSSSEDGISTRYFGEKHVSFRPLMKRPAFGDRTQIYDIPHGSAVLVETPIVPDNPVIYGISSTKPFKNSIFQYLRYAYIGMRGSFRHIITTNLPNDGNIPLSVGLVAAGFAQNTGYALDDMENLPIVTTCGTSLEFTQTNAGVEVEFPYFSNNLFMFSINDNLTGGSPYTGYNSYWFRRFTVAIQNITTDGALELVTFFSTGEDFNFLRYNGAPFFTLAL